MQPGQRIGQGCFFQFEVGGGQLGGGFFKFAIQMVGSPPRIPQTKGLPTEQDQQECQGAKSNEQIEIPLLGLGQIVNDTGVVTWIFEPAEVDG